MKKYLTEQNCVFNNEYGSDALEVADGAEAFKRASVLQKKRQNKIFFCASRRVFKKFLIFVEI